MAIQKMLSVVLGVFLVSVLAGQYTNAQGLSGDDMLRSIVYIECEDLGQSDIRYDGNTHSHVKRPVHQGTGVLINARGDLLTARHVVPGKDDNYQNTRCRGIRGTGARLPVRFLIPRSAHPTLDAMVLSFVREPGETFLAPPFVRLDQINERMPIYARGFPGGPFATGEVSHREGRISTMTPDIRGFIGTTGMTDAGMSGGPVFLETGEIVGLVAGADFDPSDGRVRQYAVLALEMLEGWADIQKSELTAEPTQTVSGNGEQKAAALQDSELRDIEAAEAAFRNTSESFLPFEVIGPDDRVAIVDTTEIPASAVVQLTATQPSGTKSACSGTMIAADMVLTAANCIYTQGQIAKNIEVFPARNGPLLPFGKCGVSRAFVLSEWQNDLPLAQRLDANLAAIRLDCDIGTLTGWLGLSPVGTLETGARIRMLGYPLDIAPSGRQWMSSGESLGFENGLLRHTASSSGGSSGSPILDEDKQNIYAVHAYGVMGDNRFNQAVGLTTDKIRIIKGWIESNRPSVAETSLLRVQCESQDGGTRFGTGFFATADGWVVTTSDVATESDSCRASVGSDPATYTLKWIGATETGVAVLQFGGPLDSVSPLIVDAEAHLDVGQNVEAYGFTEEQGAGPQLRRGYLIRIDQNSDEIVVDMNTSRGMSGAPIVGENGQFLGFVEGVTFDATGFSLGTRGVSVDAVAAALSFENGPD